MDGKKRRRKQSLCWIQKANNHELCCSVDTQRELMIQRARSIDEHPGWWLFVVVFVRLCHQQTTTTTNMSNPNARARGIAIDDFNCKWKWMDKEHEFNLDWKGGGKWGIKISMKWHNNNHNNNQIPNWIQFNWRAESRTSSSAESFVCWVY